VINYQELKIEGYQNTKKQGKKIKTIFVKRFMRAKILEYFNYFTYETNFYLSLFIMCSLLVFPDGLDWMFQVGFNGT